MREDHGAKPHEDAIEAAWQGLLASWDSDDAHRKFLALCESFDRLDAAGVRYRKLVESQDSRADDAKSRIDQLMVRAMAKMQAVRTEPDSRPRSLVLLVGVLLVVGLLAFAASFFL